MLGPVDAAFQSICQVKCVSELYEVVALCNVLKCNIRSAFPNMIPEHDLETYNSILTPATPIVTNCNIALLWSHTRNESEVRAINGGHWSPNHFVPLVLPNNQNELHYSNQSKSTLWVNSLQTIQNFII